MKGAGLKKGNLVKSNDILGQLKGQGLEISERGTPGRTHKSSFGVNSASHCKVNKQENRSYDKSSRSIDKGNGGAFGNTARRFKTL